MAKVTSKRQVTVPKALADLYGIEPGTELEWQAAGETIRVVPAGRRPVTSSIDTRLQLYDSATQRQHQRQKKSMPEPSKGRRRGWKREELYDRGSAR